MASRLHDSTAPLPRHNGGMRNAWYWIVLALSIAGSPVAAQSVGVPAPEPKRTVEPPANLDSAPDDAQRLEDGLALLVLETGHGAGHRIENSILEMRYTVWRSDGTVVATVDPDETSTIPIWRMLPGWRTAAMQMVVGETQRAWVPSELGGGKIPEGEHLVIETELVRIYPYPEAPVDVAGPPDDASTTASGLAYKVLEKGDGQTFPSKRGRVIVHYSGWTTNGKLFDSSLTKGPPAGFVLTDVIKGWTEGMQLMSVGEKTRFWIPEALAYRRQKGKPKGMLVFDIELLGVRDE